MTEAVQLNQRPQYAPQSAPRGRLNALALTSFVVVFFASVVGLVLGYVALKQVERTHDEGRGLAVAAIVLGWVGTAGFVLLVAALFVGSWVLKLF